MPDRIGRYRIIGELGRGGFAIVYLAEDRSLDARVAVKLLSPSYSAAPDLVARFISEARVLRNLAAPGLVSVYDSGEHDGRPYFVMEYCARGSIADRVERLARPLTVSEAAGLVQAIGAAMTSVHRGDPPIVHRDLKPENLLIRATPRHRRDPVGELLTADEEVIVGDFGLAKAATPDATRLTLIAFTAGYAAPEQSRGDPTVGPTVDVYAASAVIVGLLSGASPRQVRAPDQTAFDPVALAAAGPLRWELQRGLAYEPAHRQPDLGAWADALAAEEAEAYSLHHLDPLYLYIESALRGAPDEELIREYFRARDESLFAAGIDDDVAASTDCLDPSMATFDDVSDGEFRFTFEHRVIEVIEARSGLWVVKIDSTFTVWTEEEGDSSRSQRQDLAVTDNGLLGPITDELIGEGETCAVGKLNLAGQMVALEAATAVLL